MPAMISVTKLRWCGLCTTFGNVNHAVSIVGKWIFGSNLSKSLPLSIE